MRNTRGSKWKVARRILVSLLALVLLDGCSRKDAEPAVSIGELGGSATFKLRTPVSIVVPPGALSRQTALTASQWPAGPSGTVGPVFDFGPDGTQFARPVTLRLNLRANEALAGLLGARLSWARLEKSGRLTILSTRVLPDGTIEAETNRFSPYGFVTECRAAGTGTNFALACPAFGDPTIQSSVPLTLDAQAGPVALILRLKGTGGSTTLRVGGLAPGHAYSLYVDGFGQGTPLAASASGEVVFPQDLLQDRVVILQKHPASVNLTAMNCATVGTFDVATSTCTLTTDIPTSVSLGQDGLTLDCASHRLGTSTEVSGVGLMVVNRTDVKIRNCRIFNAQVALMASSCTRPSVEATTATMPPGAEGGTAFFLPDGTGATLNGVTAEGYLEGIEARNGQNLVARNVTLRPTFIGMDLNGYAGATLEDFKIDSSFVTPARAPLVGLLIENGSTAQVTRFDGSALTGFSFGIQVASSTATDAVAAVRQATVRGAAAGVVFVSRTNGSELSDSTIGSNGTGLQLDGPHVVFHNNISGNSTWQVFSQGPIEVSDTRPASPTFGHGNFWGRGCPGALFQPGVDSNRADVVDDSAYGQASAWTNGTVPGCGPVLEVPVLTVPVEGAFLSTATPAFSGRAAVGATVELLEGATLRGSAVAIATGTFLIGPSAPFSQGPHVVSVRARLAGATSLASAPRSFTVDTVAPAAPSISFPLNGLAVADGSVVVVGIAEAGASVRISSGGTLLGSAPSAGTFQVSIQLPSGTHAISASAIDPAGNASAGSAPVIFTVAAPSPGTPLVGPSGKVSITGASDPLDPFEPACGETNDLRIEGTVKKGTGIHSAQALELSITRVITSVATGAPVRTLLKTAPITASSGGGATAPLAGALSWDGLDSTGQRASPGAYLSTAWVAVVRNPRRGNSGLKPPDCDSPLDGEGPRQPAATFAPR